MQLIIFGYIQFTSILNNNNKKDRVITNAHTLYIVDYLSLLHLPENRWIIILFNNTIVNHCVQNVQLFCR